MIYDTDSAWTASEPHALVVPKPPVHTVHKRASRPFSVVEKKIGITIDKCCHELVARSMLLVRLVAGQDLQPKLPTKTKMKTELTYVQPSVSSQVGDAVSAEQHRRSG